MLRRIANAWRQLVLIAFGLIIVFLSIAAGNAISGNNTPWLGLALLVPFVLFCVMAHELGHACAARLVGWRVHALSVFGFTYLLNRRRFAHIDVAGSSDVGGFVIATPSSPDDWRGGWLVALGGAAANALVAACAIAAASVLGAHSIPGALFGGLGGVSLAFGIVNLMPTSNGRRRSDGAILALILAGKSFAGSSPNSNWAAGEMVDGVGPELWDPRFVERVGQETSDKVLQLSVLVPYLMATLQFQAALELMESVDEDTCEQVPNLLADHALAIVVTSWDTARASSRLEEIAIRQDKTTIPYWRARVATLVGANRIPDAKEMVQKVREAGRSAGIVIDALSDRIFRAVEADRDLCEELKCGLGQAVFTPPSAGLSGAAGDAQPTSLAPRPSHGRQ